MTEVIGFVNNEEDLDDVDTWQLFYEEGNIDWLIGNLSTGEKYSPVFRVDKIGYPTDFIGWNDYVEEIKQEKQMSNIYEAIATLQDEVYAGNVKAGWWTNLETGDLKPKGNITEVLSKLCLVHSEVSEACEGVRKNLMDDKLPHRKMAEVELADAVIRILDLCGHENYDLAGAIQEKLVYNAIRPDHKMEHRLAEGGKKA